MKSGRKHFPLESTTSEMFNGAYVHALVRYVTASIITVEARVYYLNR